MYGGDPSQPTSNHQPTSSLEAPWHSEFVRQPSVCFRFEQFGRLPNGRTTKNISRDLAATSWSAPSRRRPWRGGTDALELEHRDKSGESAQQSGSAGRVLFVEARFVRCGSAERSSKTLAPEPKESTYAAGGAEELLAGVRTS